MADNRECFRENKYAPCSPDRQGNTVVLSSLGWGNMLPANGEQNQEYELFNEIWSDCNERWKICCEMNT